MKRFFCEECLKKQVEIDRLKQENESLKQKLRYQQRKEKEGFFGSSTPSSKLPVKTNAPQENKRKRSGAKPGHNGHGRKATTEVEADNVIAKKMEGRCPICSGKLQEMGMRQRTVIDIQRVKPENNLYLLQRKRCPKCRKVFQAKPDGVMPKNLYGNQLLTYIAIMHYLYGVPIARLAAQLDLRYGTIIKALHRMAKLFKKVQQRLIKEYRKAPVRHADETGWRTNGRNGYAWLFATERMSIYQFKKTRSASVPRAVFGEKRLPGVLVVDRYNGYNKVPCKIQYCYAHLLRKVQDLEKESPHSDEAKTFVSALAPLLAQAMGLRNKKIRDPTFYRKALQLKSQIKAVINSDAQHLGIRYIQGIFRGNENRLYHWASDRRVPADNNLAERDLRPTVIARKTSFGSQSDAGAYTREILSTVINTLKKQCSEPDARFKSVLDKLAINPNANSYKLLFHPSTTRN